MKSHIQRPGARDCVSAAQYTDRQPGRGVSSLATHSLQMFQSMAEASPRLVQITQLKAIARDSPRVAESLRFFPVDRTGNNKEAALGREEARKAPQFTSSPGTSKSWTSDLKVTVGKTPRAVVPLGPVTLAPAQLSRRGLNIPKVSSEIVIPSYHLIRKFNQVLWEKRQADIARDEMRRARQARRLLDRDKKGLNLGTNPGLFFNQGVGNKSTRRIEPNDDQESYEKPGSVVRLNNIAPEDLLSGLNKTDSFLNVATALDPHSSTTNPKTRKRLDAFGTRYGQFARVLVLPNFLNAYKSSTAPTTTRKLLSAALFTGANSTFLSVPSIAALGMGVGNKFDTGIMGMTDSIASMTPESFKAGFLEKCKSGDWDASTQPKPWQDENLDSSSPYHSIERSQQNGVLDWG